MKFVNYFFIFILCLVSSCSGYRVVSSKNPFHNYGIKSVAIPMFLNRSAFPNVAGPFTKRFNQTLSENTNLSIYSGNDSDADAVLVGIIDSYDRRAKAQVITGQTYIDGALKDSIGEKRNQFYLPTSITYKLHLKVYLIKNASKEEVDLITGKISRFAEHHPKVLFTKSFDLSGSYSHSISSNSSVDDGGVVNFTKTNRVFVDSIDGVALGAANTFKVELINAF